MNDTRKPWEKPLAQTMGASRRAYFQRLRPEEVLRACRGLVQRLRDLRAAHDKELEYRLRYSANMDNGVTQTDTLFVIFDMLDAAGYFNIDGALAKGSAESEKP